MVMDVRNWDEGAYRDSILQERGSHCCTVFRSVFAPPSSNAYPNPNLNPDVIVAASSDGYVVSYSVSSLLSSSGIGCYGNSRSERSLAAEPSCFLQAHEGPAYDVKFYEHGQNSLLLSCGDDGHIRGWRWNDMTRVEVEVQGSGFHLKPAIDLVNPQHRGPWGALSPIPENNAIAVDKQGGSIYAAAGDSLAYCWDVETSKIKMVFRGHLDYLHCIVVQNSSNQIITGSEDGTTRLWDIRSGKCVKVLSPHHLRIPYAKLKGVSSVSSIALDASESWLTCGSGKSLFIWNLIAGEQISKISTHTSVQDVLFDGNQIIAVGAEALVSRFDMDGVILSQIQCAPQSIFSVTRHPSGVLAVAGYGGLVDVISPFGSHLCVFCCKSIS